MENGFWKHRSTYDFHTTIETDVFEALACKQHLLLLSTDIKKAFDTTYSVIKQLQNCWLTINIIDLINNFSKLPLMDSTQSNIYLKMEYK